MGKTITLTRWTRREKEKRMLQHPVVKHVFKRFGEMKMEAFINGTPNFPEGGVIGVGESNDDDLRKIAATYNFPIEL